jgi:soluble lytic murein transglycosylase-like protein
MKRLTAIAVAIAAAMTSVAAQAENRSMEESRTEAAARAAAHDEKQDSGKVERSGTGPAVATFMSRGRAVEQVLAEPKEQVDRATTGSIETAPRAQRSATRERHAAVAATSTAYGAIIDRYAREYGVSRSLARAVIRVESNYDVHKRGRAGEIGLMQIKPSTARMMGYSGSAAGLYDPETNIRWGMKYLGMAKEIGNGTTCGTLLKYNAGHAAKRMNPVSAAYCGRVKAELADAAS